MGRSRSELSEILHELCENVYFQPPSGKKIEYPCIIYSLDGLNVKHADNNPYLIYDEYSIQYITRDPDDVVIHSIALLPYCSFNGANTNDNLYHNNYRIYF